MKPGWSYRCVDAVPDDLAAESHHAKTQVAWVVVVDWLFNNHVVDGPAMIRVNILTETANSELSP